jgi:hypothetical protein
MGPSYPPKQLNSTNTKDLDGYLSLSYLSLLNRLVCNSLQGSKV